MIPILRKLDIGREKYPALTGVRALGASLVFFDHFPPWPHMHLTINVMAFFFLLSGFLIVRIYYEQVQLSAQWLSSSIALHAFIRSIFCCSPLQS
jgi:peptidoglycan/LPS O-acetylase OafA/YrhL